MFIQSVTDNQFSAAYVEDYLDSVEHLPEDVQRHISHARELDISYRGFLREVTELKKSIESGELDASAERRILIKLDQALISLQEIGDQKVDISQQIVDLADGKCRQLNQDLRNLDFSKDSENGDSGHGKESGRESQKETGREREERGSSATNGDGARGPKRMRRSRTDNEGELAPVADPPPPPPPPPPRQARRQAGKKTKTKRKSTRVSAQAKESAEEELQLEIDEPTYCLCDQISYGEMILCDNDLCPIEWFHFTCVDLGSKPKGKWYCPRCRGDRPNVMKPKSQFLKELEKYNKEKEEKG